MKKNAIALILISIIALATGSAAGQDEKAAKVDELFAQWNKPESPGAAVGVLKDGEVVFIKGYGCANLEYGVPISPATVFDLASVSKQFCALAIMMLADENKLSLDDDIHKYIPEVPDFGRTITIRHLLHHTSGLRDWPATLGIGGWRMDDVIAFEQILKMVRHQQSLNFDPGDEYTYSNTGYNLLAETVARVSGKSFRAYCDEKIFKPLGMDRTHFHDNHAEVVHNRAYSYHNDPNDGYFKAVENLTALGSSSLYSTVEDLMKWLANYEKGTAGGPGVLERMSEQGVLNNGERISYARGLVVEDYRGMKSISHGGSWGGFRTDLVMFPEQRLGVVVLCNLSNMRAGLLSRKVAEIFLAMEPDTEGPDRERPETASYDIDPAALNEYAGTYYSPELDTSYAIAVEEGRLKAAHIRHRDQWLTPTGKDEFKGEEWWFDKITFVRDSDGWINSLTVTNMPRVRNVKFIRK
ncbi:MAG TPA: serine hydrolase domain-containing protein [Acidobacteriota bacterium]|nr:serine hydrolase domain-containing protein [Acidobacteriota bacterium]